VDGIAGIFLGLIAASLMLAVLTGGPGGAATWWRAKFLGQATGHV